jgi:molecular chaperone IbpA
MNIKARDWFQHALGRTRQPDYAWRAVPITCLKAGQRRWFARGVFATDRKKPLEKQELASNSGTPGAFLAVARYGVRGARIHVARKEDVAMTTFDLAPLWRSTVGFDRLFDLIEDSVRLTNGDNYPPYDIKRAGEDHYQISLALAGFTPDEVTITAEQNVLTVEGRKTDKGAHEYLYQGISARPFRRVFNLADYVQVKGASFENGMLKIDLVREVPEAMRPRQIAINAGSDNQQLEHKQAA